MFIRDIDATVHTYITSAINSGINRNAALKLFGSNEDGFKQILDDLKSNEWFKFKKFETLTDLTTWSIAKSINRLYKTF